MPPKGKKPTSRQADSYRHPTESSLMRPEVGTQAQFRKKKEPAKYRYDDSLDPSLSWDEGHAAREEGERLIKEIMDAESLEQAKAAAVRLKTRSEPFLNWSGKRERPEFDVPTLPLFIHERLSTRAVIDTLRGHRKGPEQLELFADPHHSITDQVLKAYEHRDKWVNRVILGDSLVVMNSLLNYEGMGGQVQMIYMDPPYGVKFGSNFQPFVRKRDVRHNDDDHMTYEPEMVQAYRDTWELGLHSWLTYLRDRLFLAQKLLKNSGSIFLQINDENAHHAREIMDEVFGKENFISQISFQTTSGFETSTIATLGDYLLWYAREKDDLKIKKQYQTQLPTIGEGNARWVLLQDGSYRGVTAEERRGEINIPLGSRLYKPGDIQSQGASKEPQPFDYLGKTYKPSQNSHWKANYPEGMERLAAAGRIHVAKNSIQYRRFHDDFPYQEIGNIWTDTITGSFTADKIYVVQTNLKIVERCILMTTDPGDLVFDPTCGSGTTAYVAEQWGRRWITADVSRVPLALARQRLLTATFDYYELKDEKTGPTGGFVYKRKQNKKGEEVGGIVPHITLKSIANNEPPTEEVLVDRPEVLKSITRVTGPFVFEATIPTPMDWASPEGGTAELLEDHASFEDRMLEILRKVKTLRLAGNRKVEFRQVRAPAKTLSLSAEALADDGENAAGESEGKPVAFVFGPENAAVSERMVYEAAFEARGKDYAHLYVIGFGIEPNARLLVERCGDVMGIPAAYVEATRDLMMGDLLKNMRSSQVFSVCGLPEIEIRKTEKNKYQVHLMGLDVFDPVTMQNTPQAGDDVPAWFLDTDYNGRVFHVCQAFFPRTSAWENLKKVLKTGYEDAVWDHLAGTVSAPFEKGDSARIAVKVIDDRGNELLVVKDLKEAAA